MVRYQSIFEFTGIKYYTMIKLHVFMVVCFFGSMAMRMTPDLDKPYYDLENVDSLYQDFVKKHRKLYSREEHLERLEIFRESLKEINDKNAKHPKAVFAVNHFADMKDEEFQQYFGFRPLNDSVVKVNITFNPVAAPDNFDWRDRGVVTSVKDQGSCGSGFIFSAMGNIEGQYALKHNECVEFSEGQALDCLEHGSCAGRWMHLIMNDFAYGIGVMKETDYPYKPVKRDCHENPHKVVANVRGGQAIDIRKDEELKQMLIQTGPLAVVVLADDFKYYNRGILYPALCHDGVLHAVLLVGYGEDSEDKFWILKNSWGKIWGENGYVRLARNDLNDNVCDLGRHYTATASVA